MSIGHEVGVIKLPDMAVGHGNPSVLTNQIQRYITELSAAGSMYDQFSSPIVLDGDFELEIVCTLRADGQYILSKLDSELGYDRFGITGSGSFFGLVNSASPYGSAITFDSKLHTIVMNRVGNYCELFIDGVSHIDGLYSTSAIELDNVGAPYAGTTTVPYMDGIWLSLKIWSGGDRTTGTLVMDATKDGDGSVDLIVNAAGTPYLTRVNQTTDEVTQYTVEEGNYIGPELWELPTYTFTGTEVSGDIIQSENILQEEATYRVTFSGSGANVGVTTGSVGSTRALIGNSSVYADGSPFDVTDTVTAQSITARWQVLGTPPFSGSCSIDSVKRLLEVA